MAVASQYTILLPYAESYAPADFVVTPSNQAAHGLVTGVLPATRIIGVHGPEGAGKTHLSHVFAERYGASFIAYERLADTLAETLVGEGDAFVLELPEGALHEEALAQCINAVLAGGKALLVTSQTGLAQRKVARADLASRFKAVVEARIEAPDDMLMQVLIAKGFADRQLRASEEVVAYLLKRIERSGRAVKEAIALLDREALAAGQAVTVPFVRDRLFAER